MRFKNLIIGIFILALFFVVITFVNAAACCLMTTSNEACVNESEGATAATCQEGSWLGQDCSGIDICTNKGCCIVESECNDGSTEVGCTFNGGGFNSDLCENTPGCRDICCVLPNPGGYDFMPENECTLAGGQDYGESIDENTCMNLNNGVEGMRGCCVLTNGSCSIGLNDVCSSEGGEPFPSGFYCSQTPGCNCIARHSIGPGSLSDDRNKLYWFDSCGNQEDLVDESDPSEAFRAAGVDPFNWDCDSKPEWVLSYDSESEQYGCASLVCSDIWDNPYTDENHDGNLKNDDIFGLERDRRFRYNGESWCEYQQSKTGPGLDLPGTRHYKHYCDQGNESVETNGLGREQICVERFVDVSKTLEDGNILSFTRTEAKWVTNSAADCISCNSQEVVDAKQSYECCRINPSCVYIERYPILDDNKQRLVIQKDAYDDMIETKDAANRFLKIRFWQGGDKKHEYDFDQIISFNPCDSSECVLLINNPPSGTYRLTVFGKGCKSVDLGLGSIEKCETREAEISPSWEFKNYVGDNPIDSSGVCVPLVPLSDSALCEKFNELGFSEVEPGVDFNFYYNVPYNSFGLSGQCSNTSECLNDYGPIYNNPQNNQEKVVLAMTDDINSLCRSFGDCGDAPNLLGEIKDSSASYSRGGVMCISVGEGGCYGEGYAPSYQDYINMGKNKYDSLLNGTPLTPFDFSPLNFAPLIFISGTSLSSLFRRFRRKYFLLFLILSLFILSACDTDVTLGISPPESVNITCNAWLPPLGVAECEKCSLNWSNGGLLPDVNLMLPDGTLAYRCTEKLCHSIGVQEQQCDFIGNESGGNCIRAVSAYSKPKIQFLGASYTCSSFMANGCGPNSYTITYENQAIEISGYLEENMPVNVSFKTIGFNSGGEDYASICVYSNNSAMENSKEIIDPEFTAYHNFYISSLVPRVEPYNYYIQCRDAQDHTSEIGNVKFSVTRGPDVGHPTILRFVPEGNPQYVKFNESTKQMSIYVSGQVAECRWDNESVPFENMNISDPGGSGEQVVEALTCRRNGDADSRSYVCSTTLTGIKLGDNRFWFSCKGKNGMMSLPSPTEGYLLKGTEQLNITDISCPNTLGSDCKIIYDPSFNFTIKTVGGAESGSAGCKWAVDDFDYDVFEVPGVDPSSGISRKPAFGTEHRVNDYEHNLGIITLRFLCSDVVENLAVQNITVDVQKDITAPKINRFYRYGDQLSLETNEVSDCYFVNNRTNGFVNATHFETSNGLVHDTSIGTENFFKSRCEDRFNNPSKDLNIYINRL